MLMGRTDRAASLLFTCLIAAILLVGAVLPHFSRTFQVIVLAAMVAALWETAARLCLRLVPDWEPLNRWVATFTFAVGIAVVPATWMGHFGVLRPGPFLIWTAAALILSRFLPQRNVGAGIVPALYGEAAKKNETEQRPARTARIETALLLAAALAIVLLGVREIRGMRYLPPGHYDDLSYHLSTVATWIRHGDLRMPRFSMGDVSTSFYPVLGEVASWVLIAPFRDSDVAARWTQLPFALFSFLAAAAVARRLGLGRRSAALAAISYAGIRHVFPYLAMGAGNDHATSFFTLAALDGALALARRPRAGPAVVTGSALGLLLATKYIGVLFAPVVLAVLVLAFLLERRAGRSEPVPARRLAGLAVLLAATIAVTGGYTYLRNAVTTGNPVFPAPVRLLGVELFPGWEGILTSERDTSPEFQIDVWHFLTRSSRLFGSYFPFTLLPAALLAPLIALGRRRWLEALVFTLPAIFFLQFLFLMHDHRDVRYFLPGIALAAVAFVWLLDQWRLQTFPLRAALLMWITVQAIRQFEWSDTRRVLTVLALLGIGALVKSLWQPALTLRPWLPGLVLAGLLGIAAAPLGRTVATYQQVKLARQMAPLALERLAGPDGARVAYTGYNKPYFFFGSRLQNDLEIVPRSRALETRTYRWGSRLGEPYKIGPYRRWRGNLERLEIEFVVIIVSRWANPERQWMIRREGDFRLVYQDMESEIWQVLSTRKAARKRGEAGRPGQRRRAGERERKPAGRTVSNSS